MLLPTEVRAELDLLVEEYRSRCLWFLREDFTPRTVTEIENVLRHIERHGDLPAFRRVATIRRWLSPPSSETSAAR